MDYEIKAAAKKLEAEQKARLERTRKKLEQERKAKEEAKRRQVSFIPLHKRGLLCFAIIRRVWEIFLLLRYSQLLAHVSSS